MQMTARLSTFWLRLAARRDAWIARPLPLFGAIFLVFVLVYGASIFLIPKRYGRLIVGDGIYYYVYVRSAVLDGDLEFTNDYTLYQEFNTVDARKKEEMLARKTPTGMAANFFSVGPAILWTPIFLATHAFALVIGQPGDGFSFLYEAPILFASIAYGFAGIVLMYRVVAGLFSKFAAFVSILGIWLATNVVYYMGVSPSASHVLALFASALFLYLWWRKTPHPNPLPKRGEGTMPHPDPLLKRGEGEVPHPDPLLKGEGEVPHPDPLLKGEGEVPHPNPLLKRGEGEVPHPNPLLKGEGGTARSRRDWFVWGMSAGLMALVRWQDVLIATLALFELVREGRRLWNEQPQTTGFRRLLPVGVNGFLFLLGLGIAFIPQMLAWQILYGSPLTAPQGEGFFQFLQPEMWNVWFSTKRGLFTWSPILFLAAFGFVRVYQKNRLLGAACIVIFLLQSYINSIVNDWWGGEAFGARRFISLMPFFALGLAAFVDWIRPRVSQNAILVALGAFIVWNNLFLLQYNLWLHGIGHISALPTWQEMTLDKFTAPFKAIEKLLNR